MNKNESRYFNTARRMDKAFLEILEKKEFSYITVKEICQKADVNRSTFYLHYESVDDLLEESTEYLCEEFANYIKKNTDIKMPDPVDSPLEELCFITPEYLIPYLNFIKEYSRLFSTAVKNTKALKLDEIYDKMFRLLFSPVLARHSVPNENRRFVMSFYLHGITAVVMQWLQTDCKESTQKISEIIISCIMR